MIKNFQNYRNEAFDIILLAGQSNGEGYGLGPVDSEYTETEQILMLSDTYPYGYKVDEAGVTYMDAVSPTITEISIAKELENENGKIGNLGLVFSKEYVNTCLQNGRKVLLVKAAVGGTGFEGKQWKKGETLYSRMFSMVDEVLQLNPENRLVAFLWHQGEHEVCDEPQDGFEAQEKKYFDNLKDLVDTVRSRYNLPKLPFVCAGFVDNWSDDHRKSSDTIEGASAKVCEAVGSAIFLSTKGLPSNHQKIGNDDVIHFCRQSLYILGKRYFDAYMQLKK